MRAHRLSLLGLVAGLALAGLVVPRESPAQPVGPPNVVGCNQSNSSSGGPSTLPLVPGVAGKVANLCGYVISATAASTVFIITGSGALCGTGSSIVTATHVFAANGNMVVLTDSAKISSAPGAGFCATVGGTGPVQITTFFSQF